MHKLTTTLIFFSALSATTLSPATAQQAPAGAAVIMSEPGKALVARTVEASAKVVSIDPAERTVGLKGAGGKVVDVVCSDEVKNFDQIKLGDMVHVKYTESLYLELKKTKAGIREGAESGGIDRTPPGERPGGVAARQVVILADVVGVDPKAKTVSLRGPKGNVITLPVNNPDQFKVVKKGDQVEATYTVALAVAMEPEAAKPEAAKK